MSGTDAAGTSEIVTELDVKLRKAITALRKVFLNPSEVHLFARDVEFEYGPATEWWMSDRYVMINVTSSPVIDGFQEGLYKLTAGRGLQPAKEELVAPDTNDLLDRIEEAKDWYDMTRTQWSMADDEGKKMLCQANVWRGGLTAEPWERGWFTEPLAINEGIWTLIEDRWRDPETGEACPDLRFEFAPGKPYRVSVSGHPVGYIATAHFPVAMMPQACRLLGIVDPTEDDE
jgi:hypothetical protein